MDAELNKLDFDAIRRTLARLSLTPYGTAAAEGLEPAPDLDNAVRMQAAVGAARRLIESGAMPRIDSLADIRAALRQAAGPGATLTTQALYNIGAVVRAAVSLLPLIESEPDICPLGATALVPPAGLLDLLDRSLDGPAAVAPGASPQLAGFVRERTGLQSEAETLIRQRCERSDLRHRIRHGGRVRWQSGRAMLEVPDALAAEIRGVRRGVGSAGRNVLMEPMEAVGVNNRLAELNTRIEHEERRILRDLTAVLHGHLSQLQHLIEAFTWTDLAFAAGTLSSQLNAAPPELSETPGVTLDRAYHPVLLLQSAAGQSPVLPVPLTLTLHPDQAILLVTGPNTGGKTVVLKTVGLLVAMAQCGLHIPSEGRCVVGRYTRLMVDVGDRQSLYHHLSTFAGHVETLKRILDEADSGALVLLDELGTGTDPEEGAALAMAVLDELLERGAHGVVTTHLTPLKQYATDHDRILNAAMAFDHERLSPTYELCLGESGASLGLTIAGRGGLPDSVVARARHHLRRL